MHLIDGKNRSARRPRSLKKIRARLFGLFSRQDLHHPTANDTRVGRGRCSVAKRPGTIRHQCGAFFGGRWNAKESRSRGMAKIRLTLACWDYDRTRALQDGRVEVEGVDLTYLPLRVEETFWRMLRYGEFDVAEM